MNTETNKEKQRKKVSGALFAHATGLPCSNSDCSNSDCIISFCTEKTVFFHSLSPYAGKKYRRQGFLEPSRQKREM